jgi:hypothetical protein
MRILVSVLTLFSMLSVSAGLSVCGLTDMHKECCCTPKVVEKVAEEHGCCSEPEPVDPAPVSACTCSITPVDEELPIAFTLPGSDCTGRVSALNPFLLPVSDTHAVRPATSVQGPLFLTAPPGRQVPLYDLNASLRL